MKKFWIFLLICAINLSVVGQVAGSYTIVLNNDTSPLNASLKNSTFVYSFKKSDVLTITFKELETVVGQKSIEIISDSDAVNIQAKTFNEADVQDDKSSVVNIAFDKLKLKAGTDEVYSLLIKDKNTRQTILKFRLN
ncbi:MAG: hypothetical protein RBR87_15420 [Bacteroidales bacterium]|jgi:hypothetical protein|nr:hypothetical protein [Bacteroidales bacterium]